MEIKYYKVITGGRNSLDQPIKIDLKMLYNISKIWTGQGDDHRVRCLLDCTCFKKYYKLIVIDLSKQQKGNADTKSSTTN